MSTNETITQAMQSTQAQAMAQIPQMSEDDKMIVMLITFVIAILLVWSFKVGAQIAINSVMKQRRRKAIFKKVKALSEKNPSDKIELYGSDKHGYPTIIKSKSSGWEIL